MNEVLTAANLLSEVRIALGSEHIDVEVKQADVDKAMQDALRLFNLYLPRHGMAALSVSTSTVKYQIDQRGLQGVVNVSFVSSVRPSSPQDPFSMKVPFGVGTDTAGEIQQIATYTELAREVVSGELEWHGDWEADGNYYLYISLPTGTAYLCSYEYVWGIEPEYVPAEDDDEGYGDYGLKHIPDPEVGWFVEYVTALVTYRLGRKLSKFGGVPSPEGGAEPMDGSELRSEGTAELERLREAIKARRRPLPPVV